MSKSFAQRLAALEALEAAQDAADADRPLDETDADAFTDDEVLAEACYGLRDDVRALVADSGVFTLFTGLDKAYWRRIAERAQALCVARDIVLFPMSDEQIADAIDLIERGIFIVQQGVPFSNIPHHRDTIRPRKGIDWPTYRDRYNRLVWALDMLGSQVQRTHFLVLLDTPGAVVDALRGR